MKCKVCGYEFDDSRNNCPMCGTPVESASGAPVEMKWNTRDFPKPQKDVADIRMQWTTPEVSEGYITVPDKPRRQFSVNNEVERPQAPAEPVSPAEPVRPTEPLRPAVPVYTDPDALRVPRVEEGRLPEKFYTFQTKNEEFQRLLDKEFERLKELQRQLPESKSFPLPGTQPAAEDAPIDDFDKMLLDDTADAGVLPPAENYKEAEPAAPGHSVDEAFDIQTLEQSIQLIREEEEEAQRESEARLRKLEAMKAARDAYFKSLDEAEAKKPMRGLFWRERETVKPELKAAPAPKERENVHAYELPDLDDLTGGLTENPEHTIQFVKEDFIAAQDAMLREMTAAAAPAAEAPVAPAAPTEAPQFAPLPEKAPTEAPQFAPLPEKAPTEAPQFAPLPEKAPEEAPQFAPLPENVPEEAAAPEEVPQFAPLPVKAPEEAAAPKEASLQDTVTLRYADDLFSELEKIYTGSIPASKVLKTLEAEEDPAVLPEEEPSPFEAAELFAAPALEEAAPEIPAEGFAAPALEAAAREIPAEVSAAPALEAAAPEIPAEVSAAPALEAAAREIPAAEPEKAAEPTAVTQLVEEKKEDLAATQIFSGLPREVEFQAETADSEEELPPAEEAGGRHQFLKFLGLVFLFLVLIQLAVFGLEKLLPDAEFTKTVSQIASSIQEACDVFFGNLADTVKGWFNN